MMHLIKTEFHISVIAFVQKQNTVVDKMATVQRRMTQQPPVTQVTEMGLCQYFIFLMTTSHRQTILVGL